MNSKPTAHTLGELKATGYQSLSIKDELRKNTIIALQKKQDIFKGIIGYADTVLPDLQTALLARHNILLLGLRGQAKTRIARLMVELLDEWMPIVAGSELNDDPLHPLSRYARDLVSELGDNTPIGWVHRSERYVEKLATPDVSIADLIGDLDPIKAANLKLSYSDERVIHFGLIPRSHRCIFVINELPDLQPRIQVALFNLLQEKDIQIRGFRLRLPLDVQFVFTANPEDYTNRGSIVTPLKDRIESQILTHYPKTIELSRTITEQEAHLAPEQIQVVKSFTLLKDLIEQIAFEARESEYVDAKSGVSARLTISAYERLISAAEARMLRNGEKNSFTRILDLYDVIPAITGKVELVYEGEQEGPAKVAHVLISRAIRTHFNRLFPNPEKLKRGKQPNPFQAVIDWFSSNRHIDLLKEISNAEYARCLQQIKNLNTIVKQFHPLVSGEEQLVYMEFLLHGLAEYSQIGKQQLETGITFKDMLGSIFTSSSKDDDDDDDNFDTGRRRR